MAQLMPPDRRPRPLRALCDLDAAMIEIARNAKDADDFVARMAAEETALYTAGLVQIYRADSD